MAMSLALMARSRSGLTEGDDRKKMKARGLTGAGLVVDIAAVNSGSAQLLSRVSSVAVGPRDSSLLFARL